MRYRFLLVLILALFLSACGGELGTTGGVSGTWTGEISGEGGTAPLTLKLTQSTTTVSGTLTLSGETINVAGTSTGAIFSLSAEDDDDTLQLNGSVEGDNMQGTIAVTDSEGTITTAFTASR